MRRRTFVATSGAALLAGCSTGENDGSPESTSGATTEVTKEDKQTTSSVDSAEIEIVESNWSEDGAVVEFLIQNIGSGQSGSVNLVTQWFDQDGHYIGNDQMSIPTLHSGSNWYIEVEPTVPFEASEYAAYVEYESRYTYDELETRSVCSVE